MKENFKKARIALFILAAMAALGIALAFAPWSTAPLPLPLYYVLIGFLYAMLLAAVFLHQLQKHWQVKHRSYLDAANNLQKKLQPPTGAEARAALLACLTLPRYIFAAVALALLCYVNYLLIYYPQALAGLPGLLFGYNEAGQLEKGNMWLGICSLCVLFLCLVIIRQNYQIKQSSKLASRQNLIINAHSNIALSDLRITLADMNRLFLTSGKLEYILNAKPVAALRLPKEQALLNLRVNIKLNNDYSLTEFYMRQLSIFVGDMVIECDNFQNKFYQIFAVDNEFVLNFYIRFTDTDGGRLTERLSGAEQIKLYYNFVVKNSFSVITDIYGSAIYEQGEASTGENLIFTTKDTKANQYYYI